jgi:Cu-Zn family superoxide dismutase
MLSTGFERVSAAMKLGRTPKSLLIAGSVLALCGCVTIGRPARTTIATAQLVRADGAPAGWVRVFGGDDGMTLLAEAYGLSPGAHGIHLHAVGRCDGPDFASAQGHWNPTSHQHGNENPAGPHGGDLPNLEVGAGGRGRLSASLNHVAIAAGASGILDADATAVIIHAGPDDMRTDPSGGSGARIACGVLMR